MKVRKRIFKFSEKISSFKEDYRLVDYGTNSSTRYLKHLAWYWKLEFSFIKEGKLFN